MDTAEFVMAVGKSPEAVAAGVVAFDVPVSADHERHDRGQGEEFDEAGRPDDRVAKERRQHRHASLVPRVVVYSEERHAAALQILRDRSGDREHARQAHARE
jgi:hypothetical protein